MNRWQIGTLVSVCVTGVTAILMGAEVISYSSSLAETILWGGLGSSVFCLSKALGVDMNRNARG